MSVFVINSTQAGFPLMPSARIGLDHAWCLSVFEFGDDGDFDVHVAFAGRWAQVDICPGYWCNLSEHQAERIVEAVQNFKSCEGIAPTAYETAVVIADILTEEPDMEPVFGLSVPTSSLLPIPTPQDASQSLPRPWTAKEMIQRAG